MPRGTGIILGKKRPTRVSLAEQHAIERQVKMAEKSLEDGACPECGGQLVAGAVTSNCSRCEFYVKHLPNQRVATTTGFYRRPVRGSNRGGTS